MRTASLLVLLASARTILGDCNDACATAITAIGEINVGLQSRSIDCAKFIETSTTPDAVTEFITTSANMEDYLHVPSPTSIETNGIPTYASACAASTDYASACTCAAITASTVVAPTPTVYVYDKLPLCGNPATCAQGYSNAACGNGAGICIPTGSEDGVGYCIAAGNCGPPCTKNSGCLTGLCLTDVCCGSTCVNPSVQFVTEWAPPHAKLAKKSFGDHFGHFGGGFNKIAHKLNIVKGKVGLLGGSKNKILGPYLPENPQPKGLKFAKGKAWP